MLNVGSFLIYQGAGLPFVLGMKEIRPIYLGWFRRGCSPSSWSIYCSGSSNSILQLSFRFPATGAFPPSGQPPKPAPVENQIVYTGFHQCCSHTSNSALQDQPKSKFYS